MVRAGRGRAGTEIAGKRLCGIQVRQDGGLDCMGVPQRGQVVGFCISLIPSTGCCGSEVP